MLLEVCEQSSLVAASDYTELHNVAGLAFGQAVGYDFLKEILLGYTFFFY